MASQREDGRHCRECGFVLRDLSCSRCRETSGTQTGGYGCTATVCRGTFDYREGTYDGEDGRPYNPPTGYGLGDSDPTVSVLLYGIGYREGSRNRVSS